MALGRGDGSNADLSLIGPVGGLGGPINAEQAKRIALAAVPGEVVGTERENEDGREYIEVETQTADRVKSVEMDAATGEIVEIEDEDGDD